MENKLEGAHSCVGLPSVIEIFDDRLVREREQAVVVVACAIVGAGIKEGTRSVRIEDEIGLARLGNEAVRHVKCGWCPLANQIEFGRRQIERAQRRPVGQDNRERAARDGDMVDPDRRRRACFQRGRALIEIPEVLVDFARCEVAPLPAPHLVLSVVRKYMGLVRGFALWR